MVRAAPINGFLRFNFPGSIDPSHPVISALKRFCHKSTLLSAQESFEGGGKIAYAYQLIVRDADGKALRVPGRFTELQGGGWYIEEYGRAQLTFNLMDFHVASLRARSGDFEGGAALLQGMLAENAEDDEVLFFIEKHKLMGLGIGLIDIHLLASCKLGKAKLLTKDKRLAEAASQLQLLAS